MAGIEQIVVHSKSYVFRWVEVPAHHSISWSLQPHKKGINFGIFKHPGHKSGVTPVLPSHEIVEHPSPPTPSVETAPNKTDTTAARRSSLTASNVVERLQSSGFKSVAWAGKCEADRVSMGRYDVPEGEGGTYGLVFDNTFSKQTSKNLTFVLMTHPTNAPPKSGHHLHYSQAFGSNGSSKSPKAGSPALRAADDSNESLSQSSTLHQRGVIEDPRPVSKSGHALETKGLEGKSFFTGTLYKKRRKKGQGFAKRFFSLDFTSSTLSYYRDRHSSALRGAVPLSLAAIGANEKTREFSVDSGAEVWHLKAINKKDFEAWKAALERASTAINTATPARAKNGSSLNDRTSTPNPAEDREWERIEQLVSQVSGTRDALRVLARDTEVRLAGGSSGGEATGLGFVESKRSSSVSRVEQRSSYFPDAGADDATPPAAAASRPFWRRKSSAERTTTTLVRKSVGAQLAVPSPALVSAAPMSPSGGLFVPKQQQVSQPHLSDSDLHERCAALLHDLDTVVTSFAALIAESKGRRFASFPPLVPTASRMSLESVDQEFFDADEGARINASQLLNIRRSGEFHEADNIFDQRSVADTDASSDAGDGIASGVVFAPTRTPTTARSPLFPPKPSSVEPLPLSGVQRRTTVTGPKQAPPSIVGILRRNAGKDLSTITMPVTANEPTSLLQRLAENLEYSHLLDSAAAADATPAERLMFVAAFAVSSFANNRVKERAIRKPFNPMLGETFELVREDLGFRFIAEKVTHHPVRMSCQADSLTNGGWSFTQSPRPIQKFWGKSAELNTEGRCRVVLHQSDERFSWTQASSFLRNAIAGEKYVEPVQTMTVQNESSGLRAVATFKAGGMFSGRSEEVSVALFDGPAAAPDGGVPLDLGLQGKWTESLRRTDTDEVVWQTGFLVPDAPRIYGFTTFAATLNEISSVEDDGHLAPTDSRLRPDQRALENSEIDRAEALKARLEERQRARRKLLESHGQTWAPRFFEKVEPEESGDAVRDPGEEVWVLKGGDGGYWQRRKRADWSGIGEVFET